MARAVPGDTANLASLAHLNEDVLLNELKARYRKDDIYTYVGDILISIDPCKQLKIYDNKHQAKYRLKAASRDRHPPHIYAVSEAAYQQMMAHKKNQCCVVSGRSGAGKTETCKYLIAQMVKISWGRTTVQQHIITFNPILEAFGNAQTSLNSNSSRFLKYTQLKFHNGQVVGAKVNEYLLEKSRVVHQNPGEQNFHVFYYMFAGLDQNRKHALKLGNPDKYRYLGEGPGILCHNMTAAKQQFEALQYAMDLVGFKSDNQENLFICLAAILNMGNIEFGEDNNDRSFIKNKTGPLASVAELMGIDSKSAEDILTVSESVVRGERIRRHLNQERAIAARDAIAKNLYDRLFRWTVNRVNQLVAPTAELAKSVEIGVLDVFGFEKLQTNTFEQLYINITSEHLYHFFNQHIFTLELQEYQKEGIKKDLNANVSFKDNKDILDFFLGKPGLLALLDEESAFPKGSDTTFVQKLHTQFEKLPFYSKPKDSVSNIFVISHYAGQVEYEVTCFLEKNRDALPSGAIELMQASKNHLIELIFKGTITRTGTLALSNRQPAGHHRKRLGCPAPESLSKPKVSTISTQLKNSLHVLFEKMNQANPHFVVCIKPNHSKAPNKFDDECVADQLKYTGMLETAYMRKGGFAVRFTFREFITYYGWLVTRHVNMAATADSCRKILTSAKLNGYEIGKTKVFLKYWHVDKLNEQLTVLHKAAIVIQKMIRGFTCRRQFRKLLNKKTKQSKKMSEIKPPSDLKPSKEHPDYENLSSDDEDGDVFIATKPCYDNSTQWFKATQSGAVQNNKREVHIWFHGFITRRQAEEILTDKPIGSFLIRVSETQLAYSLSFRVKGRYKHYLIKPLNSGKYVIIGESKVHSTLQELVNYHRKNAISNDGDILTQPCTPRDQVAL